MLAYSILPTFWDIYFHAFTDEKTDTQQNK